MPVEVIYYQCIILGVLVILLETTNSATTQCRCLPGGTCWPPQADWNQLNITVKGKLITPKPTGYTCYAGPGFDATSCQQARQSRSLPAFLIQNPGSMQTANWEDLGELRCSVEPLSDSYATCQQGRVSVYGVAPTSATDIQNAMTFARQHNLRVVIKSTGHDFVGRNAAPGSFLIWMHNYTGVQTSMTFVPDGCDASQAHDGPVVTVHGGATWGEVYKQVDADFNGTHFVVGGSCDTVGATGGYVQGGGHSPLSPTFGLAVDNVLQYQIVTVNSQLLTVNRCAHKELFWALRGGGGGTFGVVVSVTYQLHALPRGYMGFSALVTNPDKSGNLSAAQIQNVLEVIARHTDSLDHSGGGGYFNANQALGMILIFLTARPETDEAESEAVTRMTAVRDELERMHNQSGIIVSPVSPNSGTGVSIYRTFLSLCRSGKNSSMSPLGASAGNRFYLGTRLIPKSAFSDPLSVARLVINAAATHGLQFGLSGYLLSGRGVRDNPNANDTSVTPAWRHSAWHVGLKRTWWYNATNDHIQQAKMALNAGMQVMRDAYPESGAYSNEVLPEEPDWQRGLWGASYNRLLTIKQEVDPQGFLTCNKCVGSELWDESENCPN